MHSVTDPLASDLGHLLETLEDETGQGLAQPVLTHGLTALHTRILRELDRGLGAPTPAELAVHAGLVPDDVATAAAELRRDRLVARVADGHTGHADGIELTARGRDVVEDLERARRAGLQAYVDRLDTTGRRRLEAAISLLGDD
jgi:DNA-binding MarR family transcriptional regulator